MSFFDNIIKSSYRIEDIYENVRSVMENGSRIDRYLHITIEYPVGKFYVSDNKQGGVFIPVCYDSSPSPEDVDELFRLCLVKNVCNLKDESDAEKERANALPSSTEEEAKHRLKELGKANKKYAYAYCLCGTYVDMFMGGITFREKNEDESLSDYRKKRLYNNIETIENAFGECKKYFLKFGAGLAEV